MNPLSRFLAALSSVTSLPLYRYKEQPDLAGLSKYLPAVGLFIGIALVASEWALHKLQVPTFLAAAVLTSLWLLLTGGIHLDGLMDTADGVFSHQSPQRMLEIMQDSRVGNFGVMTGVVVVLLKFMSIATLSFALLLPSILLVPCWARFAEVLAIGCFPYAKPEGMGKVWHDTTRLPHDIIVASIVPLLASACVFYFVRTPIVPLVAMSAILCGFCFGGHFAKLLGGNTGDTYGAVVELSEMTALLVCAISLPHLP